MKVRIKLSTLEEMTGMTFEDNKMAFAAELRRHGMKHSKKTIIRALERREDKGENIGSYITIPVLLRMCEEYRYPYCRCFTFYTENGNEKTPAAAAHQAVRTDKPIETNLLLMAYDISQLFPRLQMVKSDMGLDIDFLKLGRDDKEGLDDVPSTVFVEALMSRRLDHNKYIWQEGFKMPYQTENSYCMAAENLPYDNEHRCLTENLKLRLILREIDIENKEISIFFNQQVKDLAEKDKRTAILIDEFLMLHKKMFRPISELISEKEKLFNI